MLGPDALLSMASAAVALPGCDGVEVALSRSDTAVTRFAGSRIHQSTARLDGEARVRVVLAEGQVGVVATNELSAAGVLAAARRAREVAALLPHDPAFPGLAPAGQLYDEAAHPDDETAGCSSGRRADLVAAALAELPPGVTASGTLQTGVRERALVTSLGLARHEASTWAGATVLAQAEDSTGWAEAGATRVDALDLSALGRRAGRKAVEGAAPREVPAGRWPVVLEGLAVADLLTWLGWVAFPGKAVHEGRSALTGRLGTAVCSSAVSIADVPVGSFDAEGTPSRRTPLIADGVAVGVTHDRATAALAGVEPTGHALPPPHPAGGMPTRLVLAPGDASEDDLVAGLERGLLVTRFHYTNVVHPTTTTVTGMTRDGTFLVEDGQVVAGVRNLRFTESVLRALSGVRAVGSELAVLTDPYPGCASAPALRLDGFTFTSTTAY